MKRKFFLIILALCFLLTACAESQAPSGEKSTEPPIATEAVASGVTYDSLHADWPYYQNAEALIERADVIFVGRITEIDFAVLNTANGMPADASTERKFLYTLYKLEIEEVFKGDVTRIKYLKIDGGRKEVNVEKQLRLQRDHGLILESEASIPILDASPYITEITLDTPFLFVMAASQNPEMLLLLNPDQSIYPLNAPTTPQEGISVQAILSELGENVWLDFSKNWGEISSSTDTRPR